MTVIKTLEDLGNSNFGLYVKEPGKMGSPRPESLRFAFISGVSSIVPPKNEDILLYTLGLYKDKTKLNVRDLSYSGKGFLSMTLDNGNKYEIYMDCKNLSEILVPRLELIDVRHYFK